MSQFPLIHVLIADDHVMVAQGLTILLESQTDIKVIGRASNGREAIALFRQYQPDIVLMDLRMPEIGGVEATITIRAEFKQARIIVLTTYDGDEDIYRGLQAGAKGYVLKDAGAEELLSAIRAVHAGQQYIPPAVGAKLAERMGISELSNRELEVLNLMARGKNNQEISTELLISESTVKFHTKNIMSKLGASDRAQALITALKRGVIAI
ncbi:response regulator transcription factor [Nostoc sp. 'Lobaria pulmonaria (5183) cyanobiont']|uniref:response regulator transcription factor n=1 Tax=Nostoc sp. 'Lobaria pulmonaria (5183) cyanobiont' TaxID=1618022 RepID=UPI000CF320E3|nr:response regulator transcription factor [Nostoc sp. 'Lobaria pulmonaria (5183) cyanobiont']AVH68982.1 LuxR family transcriptional regulator [Nostoc sp. 'Lobaria pulmonaria (5183) cyanobiont']